MSEYSEAKEAKAGKETKGSKKGFQVVRVEGLQGLQDLLNQTEGGKVQSWQRVGEGATFIVVMEGVTLPAEPEPVEPEPVAAEPEENGKKAAAQKKSA